ncbi:MAG: glycine--tRNA ligase subunit beta [Zymomonas mobilis subsp. pomaceae]
MADFLLELRSEEIPAGFQKMAVDKLAELLTARLTEAGIKPEKTEKYATPRRIALLMRNLPEKTEAVKEERRGPRADAPEKALAGFLRSTGLTRDQLESRDTPKGQFLYAIIEKPGQELTTVLADIIPAIIRSFPWPKSMRWGHFSSSSESLRWVRPLKGIVALLDDQIIPIELEAITSGNKTKGHPFHNPNFITLGKAADYPEKMAAAHVMIDFDTRVESITRAARAAAKAANLTLIEDPVLAQENAGLTEWPVPLLGHFDEAFLAVPREVIQLTMRTNQKYFACSDAKGNLAAAFICVADRQARDRGREIIAGNEKVLSARLSDARFFWEQDLKIPLENWLPKLDSVLFYEGMGSVGDKAKRIAALSGYIADQIGASPDLAKRAGLLAKADLASNMVGEFPELQGIMGGYYAKAGKEDSAVIRAISSQYQAEAGEAVAAAVALADRIDSLACFFMRNIRPTGSKDPFALRRAAVQIIQTIIAHQLRLPLAPRFKEARAGDQLDGLLGFITERLKVQQREAGIRYDLIDAVLALGYEDDVIRLLARVQALQDFLETEEGRDLLAGYRRAANILKGSEENASGMISEEAMEPAEKALETALAAIHNDLEAALSGENYAAAMTALASLRQPIDQFFDQVIVNHEDESIRHRRLALLEKIRKAMHRVADFSLVEALAIEATGGKR